VLENGDEPDPWQSTQHPLKKSGPRRRRRCGITMLPWHLLPDRPGRGVGLPGGRQMAAPGAEQNDASAQCYLGVCYQAGLGVPQEYGEAANGFAKPPSRVIPPRSSTWRSLRNGQGVSQNYAEAVKWYHAAAEQGEPQAQFNLGVFTNGQVVRRTTKRREMVQGGGGAGNRPGPMQPGPLLSDRPGVERNEVEAVSGFAAPPNRATRRPAQSRPLLCRK